MQVSDTVMQVSDTAMQVSDTAMQVSDTVMQGLRVMWRTLLTLSMRNTCGQYLHSSALIQLVSAGEAISS